VSMSTGLRTSCTQSYKQMRLGLRVEDILEPGLLEGQEKSGILLV